MVMKIDLIYYNVYASFYKVYKKKNLYVLYITD